jgi:predicted RNA binding protein YcfA (HicA-like mRNA interferase family)
VRINTQREAPNFSFNRDAPKSGAPVKLGVRQQEVDGVKSLCMKVGEVIKLLKSDGWVQVRMRGSHRQFKHPSKSGLVTVAGKPSVDIPPGTLNNILKQAGLKS